MRSNLNQCKAMNMAPTEPSLTQVAGSGVGLCQHAAVRQDEEEACPGGRLAL